jgi:hypothetical protein
MPGVCSTSKEKPKGISRLTNEPIDILIHDYFGQSNTTNNEENRLRPETFDARAAPRNTKKITAPAAEWREPSLRSDRSESVQAL